MSNSKFWREWLEAHPLYRDEVIEAGTIKPNPHGAQHRQVLGKHYDGNGRLEHYFVTWQSKPDDPRIDYRRVTNFFDYRKFKTEHAARTYYRTGIRIDR